MHETAVSLVVAGLILLCGGAAGAATGRKTYGSLLALLIGAVLLMIALIIHTAS
jgi:hypothetical protein